MTNPAGAPASALVEKVALAIEAAQLKWKAENGGDSASCIDCPDGVLARAAISIVVEECAKAAELHGDGAVSRSILDGILAGIRSLDSREG